MSVNDYTLTLLYDDTPTTYTILTYSPGLDKKNI